MTQIPTNTFPRLPHGAPFLLLDRIVDIGERHGTFLKLVTAGDPCVDAHGELPAAFVLEAIAQAGGALLTELEGQAPMPGYLAAVERFELCAPVRVGDALRVEVTLVRHVAQATLIHGRAFVGDRLCAEGRVTLAQPR
jgi:3-hydroxymyristoyl/3-hydroxydecanoyl-(acyl carrier protein) dehydratase